MVAVKRITKDKNGENVAHLEVTEVVLIHRNLVHNARLCNHVSKTQYCCIH